jgi:hypothetical protein
MQIPLFLAHFAMCYIWVYISVLLVHGIYDVLCYLVDMREKQMKVKIDSNVEYDYSNQSYKHDSLHKRQYPIYTR